MTKPLGLPTDCGPARRNNRWAGEIDQLRSARAIRSPALPPAAFLEADPWSVIPAVSPAALEALAGAVDEPLSVIPAALEALPVAADDPLSVILALSLAAAPLVEFVEPPVSDDALSVVPPAAPTVPPRA